MLKKIPDRWDRMYLTLLAKAATESYSKEFIPLPLQPFYVCHFISLSLQTSFLDANATIILDSPSSWISSAVSRKLLLIPSSVVDVRKESSAVRPAFVYYILFTGNTMRCPINTKGATLINVTSVSYNGLKGKYSQVLRNVSISTIVADPGIRAI
jgi:hypothetical protein